MLKTETSVVSLQAMGVGKERVVVKHEKAQPGEMARRQISLLRCNKLNNYESHLRKKVVKFADDIEKNGLILKLADGNNATCPVVATVKGTQLINDEFEYGNNSVSVSVASAGQRQ